MYTPEQLFEMLNDTYVDKDISEAAEHAAYVFECASRSIEEYKEIVDKAKDILGEILDESDAETLDTSLVKVTRVPDSEYVMYPKKGIEKVMIADQYVSELLAPIAQIKTKKGFVRVTRRKTT